MSGSDPLPQTELTIQLRDGRTLGYADYGDPHGSPVMHFHGYPSSRLEASLGHNTALENGVRLIGVDRPGVGLSDFQPGRQILDWPDDVIELADALEIDCFAVAGISGGGPFAAACASMIPKRLTACGLVSSFGPYDPRVAEMKIGNLTLLFAARRARWLMKLLLWYSAGRFRRNEKKLENNLLQGMEDMPEADRRLLEDPEIRKTFVRSSIEAYRQGMEGVAQEGKLYLSPWRFRLESISFENIYLWHGEQDTNVPIAIAHYMAATIPYCHSTFLPDDGHISVAINHLDEIVNQLRMPVS